MTSWRSRTAEGASLRRGQRGAAPRGQRLPAPGEQAGDLDALHGPTLWLRYFHDPDELAAYEFRCGLATLTPELLTRRYGAWDTLERQLAGDE